MSNWKISFKTLLLISSLFVFSVKAQVSPPKVDQLVFDARVYTFEGVDLLESRSFVANWKTPAGYGTGAANLSYKLFLKKNGGEWMSIMKNGSNEYHPSSVLQYSSSTWPVGLYQFRVQACDFHLATPCGEFVDTPEVKIIDPFPTPKLTEIKISSGVRTENMILVNDTRSITYQWKPVSPYAIGNTRMKYQLYWKKEGQMNASLIRDKNGGALFDSNITEYTKTDIPNGSYSIQVSPCYLIGKTGDYGCVVSTSSPIVKVIDKPAPPAKPKGFYTEGLKQEPNYWVIDGQYGEAITFSSTISFLSGQYGGSVIYKFYYKDVSVVDWTFFTDSTSLKGYSGSHLEIKEFAVEACNNVGCSEKTLLSKPVIFKLPEIVNSNLMKKSLFSLNVKGDSSNGLNYCRTNNKTGKCEYEYTEIRAEAKGVTNGFNPFCLVHGGVVLTCNAVGNFNHRFFDLPEGVHTFEIRAHNAVGPLVERIHYTVFKPAEGYLTSTSCAMDSSQETCVTEIEGIITGEYPVCIQNNQTMDQLACSTGGDTTLSAVTNLGVTESKFSLVAKEPGGDRVLHTLKLKSRFNGVSFDLSTYECPIIKPNTSCMQPIRWNIAPEYNNACLFINRALYMCGTDMASDYRFGVGSHAMELRAGNELSSKLLFSANYKALYAPSGSFVFQSGGQNPCVPMAGKTSCKIPVKIEHWNVNTGGAVLYKNNQSWANLGLSSNGTPYRDIYDLDAEEGGTHWSLRTQVNGVPQEFASIDLYPTTFKSSGYSLSVEVESCEYNPLYETYCQVKLDWIMPKMEGCIFEKGIAEPLYCPPSLNGSGNPQLKEGIHYYQLRTGIDEKSPLVAQVAAIAMEKKVADISVTRKKCINTSCDVALEIFSNFDGDVCLYDNGVKVESYCGIHRSLSIGSYNLMDPLHKLELVLHAEDNTNTVIASKEVKGVPRHSSSFANVSAVSSSSSGLSTTPSAKFKFAQGESGSCSLPIGFNECEVLVDIEHRNVNAGGVVLYKDEAPWANLGLSSEGTPYIDRYALTASREGTRWSLRLMKDGDLEEIAAVNLFSLATNEFLLGNKVIIATKNTEQLQNIKKIVFYLDDRIIAEDSSYPYELNWTPKESGLWMIKVVAELQDSSRQTIDWVGIQVVDFPSQSYAHNLILQSPVPNKFMRRSLGNKIPLQATVYDQALREWKNADGSSPAIDFYANEILISDRQNRSAEVFYWSPTDVGVYSIRAVAHLDNGEVIESVGASIKIDRPLSPVISIVGGDAVSVGTLYQMSASINDPDRQLRSLVFFANGEPISVPQVTPPFHARWVPMIAGSYKLQAVITDQNGLRIRSAIKTVKVEPRILSTGDIQVTSDFGDAESQGVRWTPLEKSDLLQVRSSNNSRISYNKLGKLLINRPLKIINRSDMYDNEIVPQLIVLDAGQIELNSSIEIVGEPADLLILNATVSNAIRCKNCGFINVERATLAVATPATSLSSEMTSVGQLQTRASGLIDIDNLQASGAVSLEIIADRVMTKGHINTQQYARESTEVNPRNNNLVEPVLDFITTPEVSSVVVGSGGVSLLQGNLTVNYETLALDNTVAGTGVTDLQGAISSGAINIFATDAILLSGNLSTRSSHRAAQIYRGQLRAQDEQIQLKTIAQATTAPSLRIHGRVLSDAKVHMIGHSSEIKPDGGIRAAAVQVELIGQLLNQGYIHSYVRATSENPASDQVGIAIGVGTLDNRGEIHSMFNNAVGGSSDTTPHGEIKIASVNDIYNRFGGLIKARKVNVVSEKGKIRNGSLYAFDGTAAGGKESTTTIKIAPHNTSVLSTHTALAFSTSEPPVNNVTAVIVGDEVTLDAAQSVENINPYTEPYTSESVEISAATIEAENRANDVQIEALKKLSIVSDTYVLNSSAKLGVSESLSSNLLSIKAPAIRNERYYSRMIMESFSDHEKVQEQTNIEISNWAKGVQSRYGFYSPPGYIYSFAKAEFDFGAAGDGLLNNISYVDLYGDLKVFGKGQITTRGISLEKLAYESGSTRIVSLSECIYHERGRTCSLPSSTYSRTPEGKLIKQTPDNTLFAVNGEISAPANFFNARNDQGLTVLRQDEITKYKEEQKKAAIDNHKASGTVYIDSRCDVSSFDKETESTIVIYQHFYSNNSNIKCYNQRAYGENQDPWKGDPPSTSDNIFAFTNITDLVNKKIVLMGNTLNQQINDYRAWREAAQAIGN